MAFLSLNGTTVRVQSNTATEKWNEHGVDRFRTFDGAMRVTKRGDFRQWDLTSKLLTSAEASTLIATLLSPSLPLAMAGDLCGADCAVMPILVSNDPVQTASGFKRRVVFTLHETPQTLPPDTSANVWLFWQKSVGQFQELDGTVVSNDGDPIGVWEDQSGNDRHHVAGQDTGPDTRPTNDNGAARFPDGTPWLIIPSDFQLLSSAEIMMSLKADADPPLSGEDLHCRLHSLGGVSGGASAFYPKLDGHIYDGFGSDTLYDCGNPSDDLTEWNVFNSTSDVAQGFVSRLNGLTLFSKTVAAGHVIDFLGAGLTFGGALPNVNNSWFGNVRNLVIFDGGLTTRQRESWFDYMSGAVDDPPLP